jgi:hypothetical protein
VALIAYLACGRIARRSMHYGSGTVVLSWIGFVVPCIGWIALIQGYLALSRAMALTPSPENAKNRSSFVLWLVVYVLALIGGVAAARGHA